MPELTNTEIEQHLRQVRYPGYTRDIVSFGFVKGILLTGEGRDKTVWIRFSPNTDKDEKVAQMEREIHAVLSELDGVKKVNVETSRPFEQEQLLSAGAMTPLQAELLASGITPDPDVLGTSLKRADIAPEAGYTEDGPNPLAGQIFESYDGVVPVYQWDVDPHDSAIETGGGNVTIGEWDYHLWWQAHPAGLIYASIQAMRDDWVEHEGTARSHPVGRSDAVNLVYDRNRKGIVAIYGTVRDFRPFVEAFRQGFGIEDTQPHAASANGSADPAGTPSERQSS